MTDQKLPANWAVVTAYQRIHAALGLACAPLSAEQLLAHFRTPADSTERAHGVATFELARMIEKYEPKLAPIDPDVLAVREIMSEAYAAEGSDKDAGFYGDGTYDKEPSFVAALVAYRRVKSS